MTNKFTVQPPMGHFEGTNSRHPVISRCCQEWLPKKHDLIDVTSVPAAFMRRGMRMSSMPTATGRTVRGETSNTATKKNPAMCSPGFYT
ncbi:hypothetical protein [Rhizobium sp. N122]|uniref:hypothetical protein n=1 Tax=Rhizobium sp. N122 TaxID=1764272 RepID=UPI001179B152|nr:hypothetical protein [Rhizobium sp. N122]